jgi:hypothetical protein
MTATPADGPGSIEQVIKSLPGLFQQRDLVTANDTVVRIALFEGEFPWHARSRCAAQRSTGDVGRADRRP